MTGEDTGAILTMADVEHHRVAGALSGWAQSAFAELVTKVCDEAFPCPRAPHAPQSAHEWRRSGAYVLLIQTRDGFDAVAGNTPHGRRVRGLIRRKLAAYDPIGPYPELAHYGTADNREWKQYFVPDDNAPVAARCPFVA